MASQPELDREQVAEVFRLLGEIDEFKGSWRKLKEIRAERLRGLRQVATIESSGSSTRIEGAELSDDEVARVLGGLDVDSFRQRDASEVRGYGELLQTIFDHPGEIPLEERYVKQLHGILLAHSARDDWHRGRYKKNENHVEARHPDGRVEVIFRTASPFETPERMRVLLQETASALEAATTHPLVVLARFLVVFLAIHPFQDGNGRLSRALTTLLLLRNGYEYAPYASLERVIEDNKAGYYRALRDSQRAMETDPSAFGEWLLFFLRTLRAQQRNLLAKLDLERSLVRLSELQEKILTLLDERERLTSSIIAERTGVPARTVRYNLRLLVQQGLVESEGERRGRTYRSGMGITDPGASDSETAAILGEILERGSRIGGDELRRLVERRGCDPNIVGRLHGKALALLRRDRSTGESALTARGREAAAQHLFARRLAEGARKEGS